MSIVTAALRAMERIAPLRLAGSWDNVGLIVEAPYPSSSRRVLLTIDLTSSVADEALALDPPPSLIISYHPPIFSGLKSLTLKNPLQASLLRCAARGISVFSPHTSVDAAVGGVNDFLAQAFGESASVRTLRPTDASSPLRDSQVVEGEGRIVTLNPPLPLDGVVSSVKKHLGLPFVQLGRSAVGKQEVSTLAICAGSGGSVFKGVSADLLWTGELSHHEVLAAVAGGSHVLLCGHTNTERGYLQVLKQRLQSELATDESLDGSVEVLVSGQDRHPLDIV